MTLPPPNPALRACVVVPARDEEQLISSCLEAIATQERVAHDEYEILLVLDQLYGPNRSTRPRDRAGRRPRLRLHLLDGPGEGSGPARRVGMDAACARLLQVGRPEGLIACTDADTVVAPDWLAAQLRAVSDGARAIGGRIELADDGSLPESVWRRHAEEGHRRHERLLSDPEPKGETQHWQFSGASMTLTAAVYTQVGGLEPLTALEDEHLERALRQHDVPIHRLLSVRVTTSPRLEGRATRGLSYDLARIAHSLHEERGKARAVRVPFYPLVGVRCYVSVHFTNTQPETARIRSFAPSATGTIRSSPEAMSRTVHTPRASSSSPSMAAYEAPVRSACLNCARMPRPP